MGCIVNPDRTSTLYEGTVTAATSVEPPPALDAKHFTSSESLIREHRPPLQYGAVESLIVSCFGFTVTGVYEPLAQHVFHGAHV